MKGLAFLAVAIVVLCAPVIDAQGVLTLLSFNAEQQSDSVQITLTFSGPVQTTQCFVNKLRFLNRQNRTAAGVSVFTPLFPGMCLDSLGQTTAVASMDPRDYSNALDMGIFLGQDSTYMAIADGMEVDFIPSIDLTPLSLDSPLPVTVFIEYMDIPSLIGFDVDLENDFILLHFTDLMDITNFDATQLTLQSQENVMSYTLSPNSRPRGSESNFVKTICVSLAENDKAVLADRSICVGRFVGCSCSFPSALAQSYGGNVVDGIAPTMSRQVSKLRRAILSESSLSSMVLWVDYIGCSNLVVQLVEDEVYIVRPGEYITRISCVRSTVGYGTNGEGFVVEEDEVGTFLSFLNGLQEQFLGFYSCTSELENSQHYIVNTSPFVGLPEGLSYSTLLFNPLTIPLLYGSDPPLDISNPNIEIRFTRTSGGPSSPPDPEYRRLSPYRAEVYYSQSPNSIGGLFMLEIIVPGTPLVMNVAIEIPSPSVRIAPPAIILLPNETQVTLRCITNNPTLLVFWFGGSLDSQQIISSVPEFNLVVPPEGVPNGMRYYCAVRDPEDPSIEVGNRLALAVAELTNIPEPMSVFYNGDFIEDRTPIPIVNQFSGNLTLRCLGHAPSNISNLVWVSEQLGEEPVVLRPEDNDNYITVSYLSNEANIGINNFIRPYRGILRCQSLTSSTQATFFIVESSEGDDGSRCDNGDKDPQWGLVWTAAAAGSRDSQPCPGMRSSSGFAFRLCDSSREWVDQVEVTNCRSGVFDEVESNAIDLFTNFGNLDEGVRKMSLAELIGDLVNATRPRDEGLFPQDLNISLTILEGTIFELESLNVINNILEASNVLSWMQLNGVAVGGRQLLALIEGFSIIHAFGRQGPDSETLLRKSNIYISGRSFSGGNNYSEITFPDDTLPALSDRGRVIIPEEFLSENSASFVVITAIDNLQYILPRPPQEPNTTRIAIGASIVLSVQISTNGPSNLAQNIEFSFTTNPLARVSNPRCAFWNQEQSAWDETGVDTFSVEEIDIGEFKTFRVRARANHAGAFAVLVDQVTDIQEFTITAVFYVGCGFVIFGAVLSMFVFLLSWLCDHLRKYSIAAYLTYMSFCCSLVCAYVVLLAGLVEALPNMIGCVATSAFIHYFFTAAFAWLFCVTLTITFFPWVSKNPHSFLLFFVVGWGLPVIPVVVSLGLYLDQYITTTHCWIFFDGELNVGIFLAFIVPKLFFIALILIFMLLSCCTIFVIRLRVVKGQSKVHVYLLSFVWFGIFLTLLFLAGSWVFAMLYVNGGFAPISFTTAGWVFMAISIALGVWILLFSTIIATCNLRVDYEVLWKGATPIPKKGKQRPSTHLPMVNVTSGYNNPAESGTEKATGFSAIEVNQETVDGSYSYATEVNQEIGESVTCKAGYSYMTNQIMLTVDLENGGLVEDSSATAVNQGTESENGSSATAVIQFRETEIESWTGKADFQVNQAEVHKGTVDVEGKTGKVDSPGSSIPEINQAGVDQDTDTESEPSATEVMISHTEVDQDTEIDAGQALGSFATEVNQDTEGGSGQGVGFEVNQDTEKMITGFDDSFEK